MEKWETNGWGTRRGEFALEEGQDGSYLGDRSGVSTAGTVREGEDGEGREGDSRGDRLTCSYELVPGLSYSQWVVQRVGDEAHGGTDEFL